MALTPTAIAYLKRSSGDRQPAEIIAVITFDIGAGVLAETLGTSTGGAGQFVGTTVATQIPLGMRIVEMWDGGRNGAGGTLTNAAVPLDALTPLLSPGANDQMGVRNLVSGVMDTPVGTTANHVVIVRAVKAV